MTASLGLNLAGVERVLELEERLAQLDAALHRRRAPAPRTRGRGCKRLATRQRTQIVRWQPPQA